MNGTVGPHASDVVFSLEIIEWGNRKGSVHVVAIKLTCFDIALGQSCATYIWAEFPVCTH
jgi:hypothetical protein